MKKLHFILAAFATVLFVAGCGKKGPSLEFKSSIVTFRPQLDKSFYMKAAEDVALVVCNDKFEKYPFEKAQEVKALVTFGIYPEKPAGAPQPLGIENYKNVKYVLLQDFAEIGIVEPKPSTYDDDEVYGHDRIGVLHDSNMFPTTLVHDGYLVVYCTFPIDPNRTERQHDVYLVLNSNPDDPYEIVLHHNAHGEVLGDNISPVLVSFPLRDLDIDGTETVKLKLKWNSLDIQGTETLELSYKPRLDW